MEYRTLGKTGVRVSVQGFGCGNVGGLMVRGTPAGRERAVARAIELGVNYFDTAPSYGDGLSERHLGQALDSRLQLGILEPPQRARDRSPGHGRPGYRGSTPPAGWIRRASRACSRIRSSWPLVMVSNRWGMSASASRSIRSTKPSPWSTTRMREPPRSFT